MDGSVCQCPCLGPMSCEVCQPHAIPPACRSETCTLCGAQALHKVSEESLADGWPTHGHAAYVCDLHFSAIFRPHKPTRVLFRSPSAPPLATTLEGISLLRTAADALRQVGADVVLDARLFGDQLERLADLWEDDADRLTALETQPPTQKGDPTP